MPELKTFLVKQWHSILTSLVVTSIGFYIGLSNIYATTNEKLRGMETMINNKLDKDAASTTVRYIDSDVSEIKCKLEKTQKEVSRNNLLLQNQNSMLKKLCDKFGIDYIEWKEVPE